MLRYLSWRLAAIPVIVAAVNALAFIYAHVALRVQLANNPFGVAGAEEISLWHLYGAYVIGLGHGNWGAMPTVAQEPIAQLVLQSALRSLGLLLIAFLLSTILGLWLGVYGARYLPPRMARWLPPLAAVGQALPSYYIGALALALLLRYLIQAGPAATAPLPVQGFGWDQHLILPVGVLLVRPVAQIAHFTAALTVSELERLYVTAARSRGLPVRLIRWKHVLGNVWAPLLLTLAASLRLLIGELILVEKLFGWPGLGNLLATALVPPQTAALGSLEGAASYFLWPELLAAALTLVALALLCLDTLTVLLARRADPRLVRATTGGTHG